MNEAFFDTNILVDALHERPQAWAELKRVAKRRISRISWIEIMAGAPRSASAETEEFLRLFTVSELDEEISRRAALIRAERRSLRLPDAIVLASAQVTGRILITRNVKDFPATMLGIRIPYQL